MSTLKYNSVRTCKNSSRAADFSKYSESPTILRSSSDSLSVFKPKVTSSDSPVLTFAKAVTRRKSRPRQFTESVATKWLQNRIYFGVGQHFLGWRFPVYEIQQDGSEFEVESSGPRVWKTPDDQMKWNPLLEHVKGCYRGVVHSGSTHVPFVTTELDRHSGDVHAEKHIQQAMATARLLKSRFSYILGFRLSWCAEVNPRNGSVKLFGWAHRPIPVHIAKEIGEQVHEALGRNGLLDEKGKREVFPYSHAQVLLPMRIDKTTIIDTGVLAKCFRKKLDRNLGKMVPYETYSVLTFCKWLRNGSNFCETTLLKTLREACAKLPDEPVKREPPEVCEVTEEDVSFSGSKRSWRHSGSGADNPNSFERQHEALLELCRRIGRIATEQEALAYIRQNRLFTGSWEQNLGRRRSRVRWILKRIGQSFDPSKCRGVRHEIEVGKFDNWARSHAFHGVKRRDRKNVDEFGNIVVSKGRGRVDWRFVSAALSIIEFCLTADPNEDGSLPQARVEDLWSRCCENVPFCDRKWALCRDWLEKQGVVKVVDRNWHRGKAMRWAVVVDLDRLAQWWKKEKKPGLLEAVSLQEFLSGRWNNSDNKVLNSYPAQAGLNPTEIAEFAANLVRPPP